MTYLDFFPAPMSADAALVACLMTGASGIVLSIGFLATLYHVSVPVRTAWSFNLPGAVFSLLVWIGGSSVLRWVLTITAAESRSVYGPLAAPIAVLLWLYLLAIAVLLKIGGWYRRRQAALGMKARGHLGLNPGLPARTVVTAIHTPSSGRISTPTPSPTPTTPPSWISCTPRTPSRTM